MAELSNRSQRPSGYVDGGVGSDLLTHYIAVRADCDLECSSPVGRCPIGVFDVFGSAPMDQMVASCLLRRPDLRLLCVCHVQPRACFSCLRTNTSVDVPAPSRDLGPPAMASRTNGSDPRCVVRRAVPRLLRDPGHHALDECCRHCAVPRFLLGRPCQQVEIHQGQSRVQHRGGRGAPRLPGALHTLRTTAPPYHSTIAEHLVSSPRRLALSSRARIKSVAFSNPP